MISPVAVRSRVVATVGPACADPRGLAGLIEAGAGVLRLNLSHGDLASHLQTLDRIREVESVRGVPVAVMADLPGPKIRLARASSLDLVTGVGVRLSEIPGDADPGFLEIPTPDAGHVHGGGDEPPVALAIDAPGVLAAVEIGHRILLDDGAVRLLVTEVVEADGSRTIVGRVTSGGVVRPRVGVNLPDSDPDLPAVTPRDLEFATAMHRAGVDLVAVSFCRDGDDLRRLRSALEEAVPGRPTPWLVSKVERPAAITNIDDVVEASDAVLVARGDLGVELDIAAVPVLQKRVVAASIAAGRPVVVATQMLQSMIDAPSPTRAEATDVANAVLDGADALMLSGETAIGRHPSLAVEMLRRIAAATEDWHDGHPSDAAAGAVAATDDDPWLPALARGVHRITRELPVRAVVAWSGTGHTARILSREDLRVPLVVLTDDLGVARRVRLLRGVHPVMVDRGGDLGGDRAAFLDAAGDAVVALGFAAGGDACLFVHGSGRDAAAPTDAIGVVRIDADRTG